MRPTRPLFLLLLLAYFPLGGNTECGPPPATPTAASGVQKMTVAVDTDETGHTVEQNNIAARYKMDNTPGAIKWLYCVSPMTGDVLLASSVKGKVTSSGKRLTPKTVAAGHDSTPTSYGIPVVLGRDEYHTAEVLQDDGTYGDSAEYLYWWDQAGAYHQQYIGGCIVHISDKPMHWPKVILNLDAHGAER